MSIENSRPTELKRSGRLTKRSGRLILSMNLRGFIGGSVDLLIAIFTRLCDTARRTGPAAPSQLSGQTKYGHQKAQSAPCVSLVARSIVLIRRSHVRISALPKPRAARTCLGLSFFIKLLGIRISYNVQLTSENPVQSVDI